MPSLKKHLVDGCSLVYQSLLHAFLRDLTNYYWDKEQSQRFTENQHIQTNGEALKNNSEAFETEESYNNERQSIHANINIEENEKAEEGREETDDTSSNDGNCNTKRISIKEECTIGNLGDCIEKDYLGNNNLKEPLCNKNKTSKISHNKDFGSYLSEATDELKETSLKKNLSYTVVAQISDGDSLTYKILNNENYLGDPSSTNAGVLEEPDSILENLMPHLENEYESLNDSTVCFRDDSKDLTDITVEHSSESTSVDEGMAHFYQNCETTELNHSVKETPNCKGHNVKCTTVKTTSTESLKISTGRPVDEPKPCEETLPLDSIWNIGLVQEKIKNTLRALTSNVESDPEENTEPVQKLSDTSSYDSDDVSDTETYEELVKKVLSGTKSELETSTETYDELVKKVLSGTELDDVVVSQTDKIGCRCIERQGCLQVVGFDEADEMLTTGQMSSVDTGSVSDWLYSVPPAICFPSTMSTSTIETSSEDPQSITDNNILADGKHSKYRDEIIARTLFTHKWVGDTKKFCT